MFGLKSLKSASKKKSMEHGGYRSRTDVKKKICFHVWPREIYMICFFFLLERVDAVRSKKQIAQE